MLFGQKAVDKGVFVRVEKAADQCGFVGSLLFDVDAHRTGVDCNGDMVFGVRNGEMQPLVIKKERFAFLADCNGRIERQTFLF